MATGRDQDRGKVSQPLVQVADVEQIAEFGKLLIKGPDSAAILRGRVTAPAGAARVGYARLGRIRPAAAVSRITPPPSTRRSASDRIRTCSTAWSTPSPLWGILAFLPPAAGAFAVVLLRHRRTS